MPETVPFPEPRPENPAGTRPSDADSPLKTPAESVKTEDNAPPVEKENPGEFSACMAELKTMGVKFQETASMNDAGGCGIDRPLTVSAIGGNVALVPEGVMRCQTALSLARWTAGFVIPILATARPGETLTELQQASSYVCRRRNNAKEGKISEHARGNAIDISGLRFKSGETFAIKSRAEDGTMDSALQRAIAAAACLYFTTVLDPGSDKAHETHLHLDLITRRNGFRYCW